MAYCSVVDKLALNILFGAVLALTILLKLSVSHYVWLNGLVVSTLGILALGPGFDYPVAPLFHWVATFGKLFTHIASPVSELQGTGVQKGSFRRLSGYGD